MYCQKLETNNTGDESRSTRNEEELKEWQENLYFNSMVDTTHNLRCFYSSAENMGTKLGKLENLTLKLDEMMQIQLWKATIYSKRMYFPERNGVRRYI